HLESVEAPPAFIAFKHGERADIEAEAVRLDDRLGERRDIAEAEIEALPGDRMDAVRGVAGECQARLHQRPRQRQAERGGARLADRLDAPEAMPEAPFELDLIDEAVGDDAFRLCRPLGPYERAAIAGQRQHGERSAGQEMLLGAAAMRPL